VIQIRTFDLGGGALGDGEKLLNGGLAPAGLEAFVAFPQSFLDGTSHGLAGGLGNGLSKTVGFRIFDIEAHGVSILLQLSTLLYFTQKPFFCQVA
jgi:hypothetical protein